jgi:hypothetical protein
MSSGEYEIVAGEGSAGQLATLRNVATRRSYFVTTHGRLWASGKALEQKSRLVFRCGEAPCSLSEIRVQGRDGWFMTPAKKRVEKADNAATRTVALTAHK